MNEPTSSSQSIRFPAFRTFLWASILLFLFGWGGLAILVSTTLPILGPRWLFFFLFMSGLTGAALPVTYFFNRRFISIPPADGSIILRQAMWFGIYGCIIAWLQQGRVLNGVLAIMLALGFAIVELLLRVRELSLWKPKGPGNG
jgi:hypothetical protein